jgi:NAD+ kinase
VPLIGVNLGRLGFLADLEQSDVAAAVPAIVQGGYAIEERMTLTIEVRDAAGTVTGRSWALNEASIERTIPQRLIILDVFIGSTHFARVPADALIIATPTGSTAYSLSAGGPILSPLLEAVLVTPVAPHSLFDRTVVVDPNEQLSVRPVTKDNRCVVSVDGRESLPVPDGGSVEVSRGDAPVRLARLHPVDFFSRVRVKFNLG